MVVAACTPAKLFNSVRRWAMVFPAGTDKLQGMSVGCPQDNPDACDVLHFAGSITSFARSVEGPL